MLPVWFAHRQGTRRGETGRGAILLPEMQRLPARQSEYRFSALDGQFEFIDSCWPSFLFSVARDFAKAFYRSAAWIACRDSYIAKRHGLCERCLARGLIRAGKIVHHKIYLTPENIAIPGIALNHANLELLCQDCHNAEHHGQQGTRYRIDAAGNVFPRG